MGNNLPIIRAKNDHEKVCLFYSMPSDIYEYLFHFLDNIDAIILYFVCKTFRNLIDEKYEIDWEDQYFVCKNGLITTENWIKIYKWSRKMNLPFKKYSFFRAVNLEDLRLLKFLYKNKLGVLSDELFNCALEIGNIDILNWLFRKKCETNNNILTAVALSANEASFNWLLDHSDFINIKNPIIIDFNKQLTVKTIEFIIATGKINMLKWLYENGLSYHDFLIHFAAYYGQNEILDWMLTSTNLTISDFIEEEVCFHAALGGKLNTLKFLRQKTVPWGKNMNDDSVYYAAIINGHQELFEWALEEGCPKGILAILGAAHTGSIVSFEYLLSLGFSVSEGVINVAANGGHLHMMEWFKTHNYSINYGAVCDSAAINGHINIIEWTMNHNHKPTMTTFEIAAERGNIKVIEFLKENTDLEYDESICTIAMKHDQNYCLIWLICNDFPFGQVHREYIIDVLKALNDKFVNEIIEKYLTSELTNEVCKVIVSECLHIKN